MYSYGYSYQVSFSVCVFQHLEERLAAYHSYLDEDRLHQLVAADHQSSGASHDQHDDNDVTSKRLQQLGMELPPRAPEVT